MNAKILFVDDDREFLASLEDGLNARRPDYDILVAGGVPEALKLLDAEPIDLVVTDLKMPGQGGFELLAHMVERHPLTPSIVMTAYGTPELERQAEDLGVLRVLVKPLDMTDLQVQVDRALDAAKDSPSLQGVSVAGFLQLLHMERSTSQVTVIGEEGKARLAFVDGRLVDAQLGDLRGDAAVMEVAGWTSPRMAVGQLTSTPERTVTTDLPTLVMEAARRQDELGRGEALAETAAPAASPGELDAVVARILDIDGFLGLAVLRSSGELLAERSLEAIDMAHTGPVACAALSRASASSTAMGAGECQFLYLEGDDANVLAWNAGTLQLVLLLSPGSNPGMGRMRLSAVAEPLAKLFGVC